MAEKKTDALGAPAAELSPNVEAEKPKAPEVTKRTPAEWADTLGVIKPKDPRLPQSVETPHWSYAAADRLFGWSEHAYHYQGDANRFEITRDDFLVALKRAGDFPACELPAAAIPKSQVERLASHVPARANGS